MRIVKSKEEYIHCYTIVYVHISACCEARAISRKNHHCRAFNSVWKIIKSQFSLNEWQFCPELFNWLDTGSGGFECSFRHSTFQHKLILSVKLYESSACFREFWSVASGSVHNATKCQSFAIFQFCIDPIKRCYRHISNVLIS